MDAVPYLFHIKKTKNKPLTELQKDENKPLASGRIHVENSFAVQMVGVYQIALVFSGRIHVENSFAGLKRFRTLSDRLRLHDFVLYDVILGICAGLWNFYLAN